MAKQLIETLAPLAVVLGALAEVGAEVARLIFN